MPGKRVHFDQETMQAIEAVMTRAVLWKSSHGRVPTVGLPGRCWC